MGNRVHEYSHGFLISMFTAAVQKAVAVSYTHLDVYKRQNQWYAHKVVFPYIPVMSERGTFVDKKTALHIAADSMGLPYKEYMQLRRKAG